MLTIHVGHQDPVAIQGHDAHRAGHHVQCHQDRLPDQTGTPWAQTLERDEARWGRWGARMRVVVSAGGGLHDLHSDEVRQSIAERALDEVAQRGAGSLASGTRPGELQGDNTVFRVENRQFAAMGLDVRRDCREDRLRALFFAALAEVVQVEQELDFGIVDRPSLQPRDLEQLAQTAQPGAMDVVDRLEQAEHAGLERLIGLRLEARDELVETIKLGSQLGRQVVAGAAREILVEPCRQRIRLHGRAPVGRYRRRANAWGPGTNNPGRTRRVRRV